MHWNVLEVKPEPGWSLYVRFADGLTGRVRFAGDYFAGVFEPLRDRKRLAQVSADRGAVAWPGDLDPAPDSMYAQIRDHGEWLVTSQTQDALV